MVRRPEVQAFYGALVSQRASKGVFITTSRYTDLAVEFAKSMKKIVLVNIPKLVKIMID
jgi:restriction system protein